MYQHDRWHTGAYGFVAPTDTTPPTNVIAVLQNPVVDRVMDVFVMPSERVGDIPGIVIASASGRDSLDVHVVAEEQRIYRGHHIAEPAAEETVYVTVSDLYGNEGTESRVITYARSIGGDLVVTSDDMKLEARARLGSGDFTLAILPVDSAYLIGRGDGGEPQVEATAYNVCTIGSGAGLITIDADVGTDDTRVLCRYRDGWEVAPGQRRQASRVSLAGASPGIYAVGHAGGGPAGELRVSAARPNPFGDRCTIVIMAPQRSRADVSVFDVRGRLVKAVYEGVIEGETHFAWNGTDRFGQRVSSGIYFLRVDAGQIRATRKLILVR
jgi:hypothetical protein